MVPGVFSSPGGQGSPGGADGETASQSDASSLTPQNVATLCHIFPWPPGERSSPPPYSLGARTTATPIAHQSASFARSGSSDGFDAASQVGEEKPPTELVKEDEWNWKLNQLNYYEALNGDKKWDRERKTATTYAAEADATGQTTTGDALRDKAH